ncbi:MAG: efflux RND transporter periplasmic adaptor subunit [Rubrivivax sp.]|nr:efflux RND transporter periplasmic adaptor subunit [Rubrivivax sp.]
MSGLFERLRGASPRAVAVVCLVAAGAATLPGCGPVVAQGGPGGPPPVGVVPVVERPIAPSETFSTRLEAVQTVELRAQVSGTLVRVHFREGQLVRRGELLFTIDPRPFEAEVARLQAQVAADRSRAELARSELARAETLLPIQAASEQEVDQLRAALRGAEAAEAGSKAALDLARIALGHARVVAPISGRVSRAEVTPGNLVAAGTTLLTTLVAADRVQAYAQVDEGSYLRFLRDARTATGRVSVRMGLADEAGFPRSGRIDFVDNRLDPSSGTIRVRAVFDNADGRLTPGLSARLQIGGPAAVPATLVPDRAIGTDQTRKTVLVVGPGNVVQPRTVQPGALIGGMRVVTGVKAGEQVIVEGLQRAFPGAPVTPQPLKTDADGLPLPAATPGAAQ